MSVSITTASGGSFDPGYLQSTYTTLGSVDFTLFGWAKCATGKFGVPVCVHAADNSSHVRVYNNDSTDVINVQYDSGVGGHNGTATSSKKFVSASGATWYPFCFRYDKTTKLTRILGFDGSGITDAALVDLSAYGENLVSNFGAITLGVNNVTANGSTMKFAHIALFKAYLADGVVTNLVSGGAGGGGVNPMNCGTTPYLYWPFRSSGDGLSSYSGTSGTCTLTPWKQQGGYSSGAMGASSAYPDWDVDNPTVDAPAAASTGLSGILRSYLTSMNG